MRALFTSFSLVVILMIAPAHANNFHLYLDRDNLALEGHDPVAYHTIGQPTRGLLSLSAEHDGAIYRFASEENRHAFLADPDKYLPEYGGFCAYGLAGGYKVHGDPKVWNIVDGRLYLNYSPSIGRRWERDIPGYISQGDANWPGIRNIDPRQTR